MIEHVLIVQIVSYETTETELNKEEMERYIKEKLTQMHHSIQKDGQPLDVIFSQTMTCKEESE